MQKNKLVFPLIAVSLALMCGASRADEETAAKPAPKKVELPPAATKQGVTFANDIKPLFDASCVRCHSGQRAKAKLHLDTLEGVLKGSEDGPVLTAGNSAKSKIVLAVARVNPKTAMPPEPRKGRPGAGGPAMHDGPPAAQNGGEHAEAQRPGGPGPHPQGPPPKPLTPEQVGLVRAWIDQGAK